MNVRKAYNNELLSKGDTRLFNTKDWHFLEVFLNSKRFIIVNGRIEMEVLENSSGFVADNDLMNQYYKWEYNEQK